ncbi:MAG: virulence protein SciE type [Gemmatimonadaceae bacterium]|jgi:type VI secretion system protein ImpE|nr:virulence protein SciE type [Gemmatimonadaceae bacterium]
MNARELFDAGQLGAAIEALSADLRNAPTDTARRTFLFELLCFAGLYDRAEKHLDLLADGGQQAAMGALLYRSALHAARARRTLFASGGWPGGTVPDVQGTLNGRPFTSLRDADPRIGARLELFAAGQYTWIPFAQVELVRVPAPSRLRDLLWAPGQVKTAPDFQGLELGEVLLPVLGPFTEDDEDDAVRLGRASAWVRDEAGTEFPVGQKLWLVDGEEMPLLDVRELIITGRSG